MELCAKCGEEGVGRFCGRCGGILLPDKAGNALTWPFYQRAWSQSLWMPLLWWLPILGNFLATGWSLETIRRRALCESEPLPQPEDGASILGRGLLVVFFAVLYFVIPLTIMGWLLGWAWLLPIWKTIRILWSIIWGEPHESLASFLLRNLFTFLVDASTPLIYVALMSPAFLVARVRFAITGRASSFFLLLNNVYFCFRHVGDVLYYFLLAYLLRFTLAILSVVLVSIPVVGLFILVALVGLGYWARAFWAGRLATLMLQDRRASVSQ